MENLNAEQIKKALECCNSEGHICGKCPYESVRIGISCRDKLIRDALALITSQEQRIKELTEENKRLRTAIPLWAKQCVELEERCMQLRADTVQKYRKELHRAFAIYGINAKFKKEFLLNKVDQMAKEITEETK